MAAVASFSRSSRLLAAAAVASIAVGVLTLAALHVVGPTASISPVRRTISEYQLTSLGWAFNVGVVAVAAGSLALLVALVAERLAGPGGIVALLGWIAGLLTLAVFPKHNWAVGPSSTGQVHRVASLVAFLCLPVAVMLISRRRSPHSSGLSRTPARWSFGLAAVALLWFAPIVVAIARQHGGGAPWWQGIPLGLVERGLALTEVLALLSLGVAMLGRRPRGPAPGGAALVDGRAVVLVGGQFDVAVPRDGHPR